MKGTWLMSPGSLSRPLVIAHRGMSAVAPENTIEAFALAMHAGADGIELDTRLTRDGVVAVMHDRRVDRTTSGAGVVGSYTMEELKRLDAGSWRDQRYAGARVPTLDEVFEALPKDFLINVEMKVRGVGVWSLASRVIDVVRRHNRLESTLLASFHPLALAVARLKEPQLARGFIWSRRHPLPLRRRWLAPLAAPHWMNPDMQTFSPKLLRHLHKRGQRVLSWDVDAGTDVKRLGDIGLDGVVTDSPDVVLKQWGVEVAEPDPSGS